MFYLRGIHMVLLLTVLSSSSANPIPDQQPPSQNSSHDQPSIAIHPQLSEVSEESIDSELPHNGEMRRKHDGDHQVSLQHIVERILRISQIISEETSSIQQQYVSLNLIDREEASHLDRDVPHTHFTNLPDTPDINMFNFPEMEMLYQMYHDLQSLTEYLKLLQKSNHPVEYPDIAPHVQRIIKGHRPTDSTVTIDHDIINESDDVTINKQVHHKHTNSMHELINKIKLWIERIDLDGGFKAKQIITSAIVPDMIRDMDNLSSHFLMFRDYSILHHNRKYMQYITQFSCGYLKTRFDEWIDC